MVIYLFTNKINNKQYVGLTTRDLEVRKQEHLRNKNGYFANALKHHGVENFNLTVIDEADNLDELNALEIKYIQEFNTMYPNGYNLCLGGGVTDGFTHSEESKRMMSMTKKAKGSMVGEKNHFYGKTHTEEAKSKMSKVHKGKVITEESRERMSKSSASAKPVRCITDGKEFISAKKAGDYYGITPTHISRVCRGVNKTTHGMLFEFIN